MSFGITGTAPITRRTTYKVTYGGTYLGLTDMVDPSKYKNLFEPIVTGSTGMKNKLGDRLVGVDGVVSVQFRQTTLALYQALSPWSNVSGGAIQLSPPLNSDLYAYSKDLLLHPDDMGTATTEDIEFPNAVPITPALPKRDGAKDDVLDIDFAIYLPRSTYAANPTQVFGGAIGTYAAANVSGGS